MPHTAHGGSRSARWKALVRRELAAASKVAQGRFPGKAALELFTTLYAKDLNRTGIGRSRLPNPHPDPDPPPNGSFLAHIEHPILWAWAAQDVPRLIEAWFPAFEQMSGPGRMLGLYAYDFSVKGGGDLFPLDTMARQLDWALQLLHEGRVSGVAFEGLFDLDLEAAEYLRSWIQNVSGQPLRIRAAT